VSLDLGAIRDFDYYTGVIFEGYGPEVGRPLAQGGRYDGLLACFGRPAPATGFMIHLDLMGEVLRATQARELTRLDAAVAWSSAGLEGALRLAGSLRMFGMRAVMDTEPRRLAASLEWRATLGAANLLHVSGGRTVAWSAASSPARVQRLPAEHVVARLAERGG
jgi:ATP phosphoribosyltransferase regulatory subunit